MHHRTCLARRTAAHGAIWLALLTASPLAAQIVLFDGGLGTTPSAQGWVFIADPFPGHSVFQTPHPGFTTLDSLTPMSDRGGYFSEDPVLGILKHPDMPIIDRHAGFSISFDVRVNVEAHLLGPQGDDNGDGLEDRAGFSVIAISDDLDGIEIAFWQDRIWAQEDDAFSAGDLFTQAEGVAWDTTASILTYELRMFNDAYQILPGGGVAAVLAGRLRKYTSFMGAVDPYEIPSFLFFGDNTTRGEAQIDLARIAVSPLPDPTTDADALVAEIVAGTHNPFFDLTGDGLVTTDDLASWLTQAGEFYLGAGRTFLAGDANLDGTVDGQDFVRWNGNKFSALAAWSGGDFTADGFVDGLDFTLWNQYKFQSALQRAIPEPAAWILVVYALFVVARCSAAEREGDR
jgi:hypothetical protein